MLTSWKLGRVSGIDVYLHPTFLFVLLYAQLGGGGASRLLIVLAAFGCVLLHEFGHALMARRFGIGTADITLYPIGGVARLNRMPRSPGAELLIALAGPAVNFAIAAVLFVVMLIGPIGLGRTAIGSFAVTLILVNLLLGGFNLIPAFPMDGGRVLRALLSGWLGRLRATQVAAGLGRWLALAFGLYCVIHGYWPQVILAAFIYLVAGNELAGVVAEEKSRRYEGDAGVWTAPPGYHWVQHGNGAWQLAPVVDVGRARWN